MYWCLLWTNIPSPDLHSLASWWVTLWIGTIVKKFQQFNTNNKIKWKGKAEKLFKKFCLSNDWKFELSDKIQEAGNKELASFFTLLVGLTGWQKKGRKPQNAGGSHFVMVSQLVNKSFITKQILVSFPVNQSTSVSKRVGWWFVSSGPQTLGSWGDKTPISFDRGKKYSSYWNIPSKAI